MSLRAVTALLVLALSTGIGCAPPSPDDEVGDSDDALTTTSSGDVIVMIDRQDTGAAPGRITLAPGSTTRIGRSLHLTVRVRQTLVGQLKGCATGFSTQGLTPAEVAAKDAEILQQCATANVPLVTREGWTSTIETNFFVDEHYDATPLLGSGDLHLVFSFAAGSGPTRAFVFVTGSRPGPAQNAPTVNDRG